LGIFKHCYFRFDGWEKSVINLFFLGNYFLGFAIVIVKDKFLIAHGFLFKLFGFHQHFFSFFELRSKFTSHIPFPIHTTSMCILAFGSHFFQIIDISRFSCLLLVLLRSRRSLFLKISHKFEIVFSHFYNLWSIRCLFVLATTKILFKSVFKF